MSQIPKHFTNYVCPSCKHPSNHHSNEIATLPINLLEIMKTVKEFCNLGDNISVESVPECMIGQNSSFLDKMAENCTSAENKDFVLRKKWH